MRPYLFIGLALVFFGHSAYGKEPGSSGFVFLKISAGAKNAGMGDVGVAKPADLYGLYFNPAAPAGATHSGVGFMHHEYLFESRREYLAGVMPVAGGALSLGFDYFKIGSIEVRQTASENPLGLFDAQDMLFFLGYARQLGQRTSVGGTVKYSAERIESETADSWMLDLGLMIKLKEWLTVGASGRDLGTKPKFKNQEIDLPVIVAGGLTVKAVGTTFGADISAANDSDPRFNLGAERTIADMLALRAGYKIGYDEEDVAFGLGFFKSLWEIDYAFVPFSSGLGSSHRFSLTFHWK